ncbi:MAG: hypothetical protein ACLR56_03735 [Oscillospiraceae bacterium]
MYAVSTKVKSAVPEMFCLYNKTLFEQNGLSSKYNLKELALNKSGRGINSARCSLILR